MKSLISSLIGLVLSVSAGAEPLLEGRVRLESGEPVADAQVRIFDLSDLRQGPVARAQTDGTGYFALPLAALTGSALPERFTLGQNYPNPFNPSTIIPYQLATSAPVRLEVFNLLGQHIATLVDGERSAGFHTATWHATDAAGRAVGAGVYVYRMTVGVESQTGRMVLIDGQAGVSAGGAASVWSGTSGGGGSYREDAQVYGLVVSGSGLAPYVDSAFRVESGMAPVELVVSAGLPSAGKVADDDCAFCDFFGGINYAEETDSTSNQRGPDLIVESLSLVGSASVSPGGTLTLLATVRNQGDSLATATMLHYYRSTDATISTQDTGVGTDAVDALAVAGTSAKLIRLTTPSSEGTYYYGACVASVAGESNTNNNCSSSRVVRIWSESSPVTIPDAKLRAAIAAVLGKASGETITKDEMETLRRLEAEDAGISDLTGLEFATNLTLLSLNDNNLTDVSALAGLTKLEVLNLSGNQITDISALAGLTRLWWLGLSGNQITDVSALAGLTKLTHLYLWNNRITDVSTLAGLTKLIELFLNDNPLSASSINDHIPILQARGVAVTFDPIDPTPVTIPDANLRAAIAAALGKARGATITKDEISTLVRLDAKNAGINDLTGLEFATNLTWLGLSSNQITDISALAGLTKLEELSLSRNQITDISALVGLTNLIWLHLWNNQITDISALAGLTNLTWLHLGDNQITDISALAGLTKPTHLYLWNNQITDISALAGLTKLEELSLSRNQITELSALAGLTKLKELELRQNPLSASSINDHIPTLQARGVTVEFDPIDPTPVTIHDANLRAAIEAALGKASGETITKGEMSTLVRLRAKDASISDLTGLEFATNLGDLRLYDNNLTDVSALAGLTKLETLGLDGNQITDIAALAGLTNLTELYLSGNQITDISALARLTNLTHLYLWNNQITDVSALAGLINLRNLHLRQNPLSASSINDHIPALQARGVAVTFDPTPVTIIPDAKLRAAIAAALGKASDEAITKGEMETLTTLDAEDAGISDLTGLEFATNLGDLSLGGNQITDLSALASLTNLEKLKLSDNQITDISALAELTKLTELYIGNNKITDISALAGLTKLKELRLSGNKITDVSALAELTNLTELRLNDNPLSASSINDHIPTLQNRGVTVEFDPTPVTIPDVNLRVAIAAALGKARSATITKDEISTLLRLDAEDAGISDLTGLEFAINLTWLGLSGNQITNLSALADLTNLETLNLLDNQITNLSALAGLTNLRNLYLGNNQITNLSALADLTNLRNLYLWNNQIADVSALAGLTNLRNLRLNDNPLSASSINDHIPALQDRGVRVTFEPTPETITDAHIPATIPDSKLRVAIAAALGKARSATITKGEMSTLLRLDAKNAGISDLTGLEFAINLENLKLYGNQITDVSALEGLTKLTWLGLSVNQITDVSALEGLTNLETLKLSDNQIMDVSALSRLTNLETLILSVNQITDVSALSRLTKLKELYLSVNQIADVSALEGLTKLKELYLSVNQITDVSALSRLTNLETLSLSDNQITDMSALQGLTNLRILRLNDNPLSASSINDHIPALQARGVTVYAPDPTPVTISDANLRAAIAAALGKARGATITKGEMETLRRLEANEAGISDLTGLEFATNLRNLSLSYNQIADVSALSRLTNLETLVLSVNQIADVSVLAGLTNLTRLELAFNNISDVSSLQDLTNLTRLDLRANPLSASTISNHIAALKDIGTTVRFDPPLRESDFDIELVFLANFTQLQKRVIEYAARRWMSIIREDLPDYTLTQGWSGNCGDHSYKIPAGERIDDLRIYIASSHDNSDDAAAGWASLRVLRETSHLSVVGCMWFNLEFIDDISFVETTLHEIGHVLGVGTLWDNLGFLQNPSENNPNADTHFNGPLAIAAFNDAGGRNYAGSKVPVHRQGGPGAADSHWRYSVLEGELMTYTGGSGQALSAITLQSLADLGYAVDVTQAAPYTLPDAAAKASAKIAAPPTHAEPEWSCGTGQHQEPIYVVDPQGRIVRTISP